LTALAVSQAASAQTPGAGQTGTQTICGRIVGRWCPMPGATNDANEPRRVSLLLDSVEVVDIEAHRAEDVAPLLEAAQHEMFRRVCVTGGFVKQRAGREAAIFAADSPVFSEQDARPDWPTEGLSSACDAGFRPVNLISQVRPAYTADAMAAGIEGVVEVQALVDAEGKVAFARVLRSLDAVHGLDAEAVRAAKQWRFRPASKDGHPVGTVVTIEMTMTLRDKRH
jgi:TonB family protein